MEINEIDSLIDDTFKENRLNKINNIYLTNKQINILDKYKIDYKNKVDIKDLIFEIEEYLNDNYNGDDVSDLEYLSEELAEFNYYHNTNK